MGTGSEDCLTVDVHRPLVLNSAPNHVIVYVGGKNFQEDSGRNLCPACLSRAINAIVVTVQYRLGILGFLAHEALASENPRWASTGGMNGFYDVIVALKWVNYNIVSWGGDPAGVTLMGESAGASLVAALIVNPLSQGLVSRAIVQSGSVSGPAVNDYDVDDANFTTTAFFEVLRCRDANRFTGHAVADVDAGFCEFHLHALTGQPLVSRAGGQALEAGRLCGPRDHHGVHDP